MKKLNQRANRCIWYWLRARSMTAPELTHRVREQAHRLRSRFRRYGWHKFELPDGTVQANSNLVAALSKPISDSTLGQIEREVGSIRAGSFTLLGVSWPAELVSSSDPLLWSLDPTSGRHWPTKEAFCFDVNYRQPAGYGDVKFVWELNRLQLLQPVAILARVTGSRRDVQWLEDVLSSWMEANPPFQGVNWSSGIELALRLVSLTVVVACIGDHLSEGSRRQIRAFVAAHGYWLYRNPSLYSSANNHRVAEGLGLLLASQLVPDLADGRRYHSEGVSVLENALHTQFFPDGIGVEQSPSYTAFTLEMLAFAALVLEGTPESQRLQPSSLIEPAKALGKFLNDEGVSPNIGDCDETRIIAGPLGRETKYIASVLAAIAGLSKTPEVAPPAKYDHLRDLIFESPEPHPGPNRHLVTFAQGGYTIHHGTSSRRRTHLVFDHGPMGFGTIAAHGHADALALWLSIDGHPVLVDAGTYLYYSIGAMRDVFRSSASHSTLEVNGCSQSVPAGAFNWRRKAKAQVISVSSSSSEWSVEGQHDGFLKDHGVIHNRKVSYDGSGFAVLDRLTGAFGQVQANIGFLLDPSVIPERCDGCSFALRRGGSLIGRMVFSGPSICDQSISLSQTSFSPSFNEVTTTNRIDVSVISHPADPIITRIEVLSPAPPSDANLGRLDIESSVRD
jgi:hypothetical protein